MCIIEGLIAESFKRNSFIYKNIVRDRPFNLKGGGGGGVMVFCFVQNIWFYPFKVYSICTCNPIVFIDKSVLFLRVL
jgi:hypothetical protein